MSDGTPSSGEVCAIAAEDLHTSLADPVMASMNFLNQIADENPRAVSFAPGRPLADFFEAESIYRYLARYQDHLRDEAGCSDRQVREALFQYGRTKGIVHELIARNLSIDEEIEVDPASIVVTVGAQEAMYLTLRALRRDERDVLLTVQPTYLGIMGAAKLADLPVATISDAERGIDVDEFASEVRRLTEAGHRPRALYVIPDFANPTGRSLDVGLRRNLLAAARELDVLLLEDNPYGLFTTGSRRPTLKMLDDNRQVLYIGSFAKTGLPGCRIGFAVADQPLLWQGRPDGLFADSLAMLKSMVTINTPPIAQAVLAGKLLENGFSLRQANERENEAYALNRRQMLDGLEKRFGATGGLGVRWNSPEGGFFIVVSVPFPVDEAAVTEAAREHGVLFSPMSHFYGDRESTSMLRLSCSNTNPEQIELGLDRLAAFIHARAATQEGLQ